ncbi:SDR family oxidoreductase [Streptomyces sp. NPDC096311]|uniref:SDR family oxidoreductase n=1 Tax=Streptomyces sp. NPDC096311 TaxID=3366083 RepID=UPI00380763C2
MSRATADWSLDGKVAVVTGTAPGGIGETYARALAEAGASVVCADIQASGAKAVADTLIGEGHRAVGVGVDITDPDSTDAMAGVAVREYGGVDILVNNAALMAQLPQIPVLDYDLETWHRAMDVNVNGALHCCRSVVDLMRERGGGRIVNQSSGGAYPPSSVYGITKIALVGLTTALARDLGPDHISVNAIAPGMVESSASLAMVPEGSPFRTMMEQVVVMRPAGQTTDLIGALLLLTAPAGDWITGQVLHVDGGWILRP